MTKENKDMEMRQGYTETERQRQEKNRRTETKYMRWRPSKAQRKCRDNQTYGSRQTDRKIKRRGGDKEKKMEETKSI